LTLKRNIICKEKLKIRKSYACSVKTLHHEKLYGDQESCRLDLKPNPDDI
jgi:hypothetical protein